jgi:His/Glu/Gln/Arg/opine family amino acid ABC transporter permease subunit
MLFKQIIDVLSKYYLLLLKGLRNTLIIAPLAFIIGLVLGTIIALIRVSSKKHHIVLYVLDKICSLYVTVVRGTPVVVQLLLMYFGIFAASSIPAIVVAIIVFGLNSTAYMAEIMRASILSIDKGQIEASRALGLSNVKTMLAIVMPQCIKHSLPTILNELIALLKETSVAGYITVIDLTMATQRIVSVEYIALAPYICLALIYLVIVSILTFGVKLIERKLRKND